MCIGVSDVLSSLQYTAVCSLLVDRKYINKLFYEQDILTPGSAKGVVITDQPLWNLTEKIFFRRLIFYRYWSESYVILVWVKKKAIHRNRKLSHCPISVAHTRNYSDAPTNTAAHEKQWCMRRQEYTQESVSCFFCCCCCLTKTSKHFGSHKRRSDVCWDKWSLNSQNVRVRNKEFISA